MSVYALSLKKPAGVFNLFSHRSQEESDAVIMEAFSRYLQAADPAVPASRILVRWLWERLTLPPRDNVDRVLRHEISIEIEEQRCHDSQSALRLPKYAFVTNSDSGQRLLKSLYEYSMSYEQQKWSRWVHCVKASDFNFMNEQE